MKGFSTKLENKIKGSIPYDMTSKQCNTVRQKPYDVLVLNSNPWFSAVSDYSLQFSLYLKNRNYNILYCSEKDSTKMDEKCHENNINFKYIPIHNLGYRWGLNFFISFYLIIKLILFNKSTLQYIFVFEGREHTLCGLVKIFFPFLMKKIKLVRIRGQAQQVKNNFFSRLLYLKLTHKTIFAAQCVKNRVQFTLPENKYKIVYYGKPATDSYSEGGTLAVSNKVEGFLANSIPQATAANFFLWIQHITMATVFCVLGRYDKVKGHSDVLTAYLKASFTYETILVLIGVSENIDITRLMYDYKELRSEKIYENNLICFYEHRTNNKKSVLVIDKKLPKHVLNLVLANVDMGIIASHDSEVICRVGVEYMQHKIPVLYTRVGALPEVFKKFPEFSFEAKNIHMLKEQMEYYTTFMHTKKSLYTNYRTSFYNEAQTFNEDVYAEILS